MKKIGLLALGLALALGVVAEAGSIPADRVPLQTYAVKKLNCYLQPNGVQKGWIDPGDYVVVTQIRSDGWAYGSYPVGNGRVSRWFRADDLVNNIGFANQERYSPKANTNTYTGPDHSRKFGSFNDNETLLVVSESGESRQFIYKVNGVGYKMAWAPYWDCWDARQAGKQQVNNNVINKNPIVKPVQREDKKQEQSSSYGVWKATARYRANTYDNPSLSGARAGWITSGSDIEVLGENAKSYYIRYWADNGATRKRYVERTAVKGLNEDKENKKQVNNNVINKNPIVKPVQREDKKQEQSSSYGVWKATARYRASTYDNPSLSGARAGWVTAGSDLEVLGENAKSYFIRYWADNGATRERYVERTAVKGLNEDKENKKQVNNNVINKNPIVKPVQREDKKQEQTSYGVWKATARYTANTYDNPDLRGMRAGMVTSGSDIEVLGENAKSYFIRYWADNGATRERYVERTAVKGLNEDKENINNNNNSSSFYQWSGKAKYRTNTYDNESLSGARAGWVTAGSDVVVLAENSKSFFIRYWTDNGDPRERYVMKSAIQKIADGAMYGVNKAVEAEKKENYIWPVDCYKISTLYYYLDRNKEHNYVHSSSWRTGEGSGEFDHHESIDIAVPTGYSVRATAAGVVVHAYNMFDQYGKVVIIRHANNVYSLYGHLSRINVAKGANVSQGDIIGQSGNTGNSTGAHLHFAISKFNDQNMNTWKYFRDKYKFSYPTNGITANKKHSDRDSYSKEAIQWLNSHPHETW
ncbi:M23 family metallopeptidase [Phascolarctobacterium succinatutens]|uniref:M23 family metallopeptidase n=1 Tax=Phascolarctobacterium succinatutens TaxID=626940 RepID=UPI00307BA96A